MSEIEQIHGVNARHTLSAVSTSSHHPLPSSFLFIDCLAFHLSLMPNHSLTAVTLKLEERFKASPPTEAHANDGRLMRASSCGQRDVYRLSDTRPG